MGLGASLPAAAEVAGGQCAHKQERWQKQKLYPERERERAKGFAGLSAWRDVYILNGYLQREPRGGGGMER